MSNDRELMVIEPCEMGELELDNSPVAENPDDRPYRHSKILKALCDRPLGVDARVIGYSIGVHITDVYNELNALVVQGLARRSGTDYQPTPLGAARSAGQR